MKPALSLVGIAELAELRANVDAGREGLVGRGDRADDLDELHDLRRVEVVQAEELLRPRGRRSLVDHRAARTCSWRRRASGLTMRVDLLPHLELGVEVLGDRLDHEVAVGEVARSRSCRGCAPRTRVGVLLLELALLDRAGELLLDLADALGERLVVDLAHDDVVARLRRRPARCRGPSARSRHADLLDLRPPGSPSVRSAAEPIAVRAMPDRHTRTASAVRHVVLNRPTSATRSTTSSSSRLARPLTRPPRRARRSSWSSCAARARPSPRGIDVAGLDGARRRRRRLRGFRNDWLAVHRPARGR